jgi:hypothetical protein
MQKRFWTPAIVIEELKRTRCNGPRANRKLDDAARRCFGSVRAALNEAGLPCGRPQWRKNDWSKDKVVEAIRKRHRNGENLLLTNREDRALYEAAKKCHGSWTDALAASGFPVPPREFYTADEVRLRIIELYEQELPLTFNSHKDVKLQRSAKKHFGGWRRAVESLGLGSELRRRWTDQAVIDAILHRRALGLDLSLSVTRKEDSGLFGAAVNHFGTWHNALQAAGIEARVRQRWSKEKVVERLREHAVTIPLKNICKIDPNLARAAVRRFGSMDKAMEAAGLTSKPIKRKRPR